MRGHTKPGLHSSLQYSGLDPGWYVDRVMVKDIQTGEKYYFLVNSWLQVYPDDDDETCLEKTVRVASTCPLLCLHLISIVNIAQQNAVVLLQQ